MNIETLELIKLEKLRPFYLNFLLVNLKIIDYNAVDNSNTELDKEQRKKLLLDYYLSIKLLEEELKQHLPLEQIPTAFELGCEYYIKELRNKD